MLIIGIGVFVGGLLRQLIGSALRNVGFDRLMEKIGFGKMSEREDRLGEFSELVAYGVQIAVVLLAVAQALDNLALDTWSVYVNTFLAYLLKNVVVAMAVVLVGFVIGKYVSPACRTCPRRTSPRPSCRPSRRAPWPRASP